MRNLSSGGLKETFHVCRTNRMAALPCEEHLQIGCFHGPEGVSEPRDMKMYPEFKTLVRKRTQVSSEDIQEQCEKKSAGPQSSLCFIAPRRNIAQQKPTRAKFHVN